MFTKKCGTFLECMANSIPALILVALITVIVSAAGYVFFEGYTILQSVEWAVQTMTSVGYGNYPAQTVGGSIWSILMMLWGVVVILSLIVAVFVEAFRKDEHKLTDAEQDWVAQSLVKIAEERGITLDPYPDSSLDQ